jgi:hypothetical protein
MKKLISTIIICLSLITTTNTQAQDLIQILAESAKAAKEKRLEEASKIAPSLIPITKTQSYFGSYLIEQLTIQAEAETSKRDKRNIERDIKKIKNDLNDLNRITSEWENKNYSKKLDQLSSAFDKYLKKYNNIIIGEVARIEEAKKAEQDKLAAIRRAEQESFAIYKTMCEGTASDDPFAAISIQNNDNRLKLTAEVDREKIMLQATVDGCLWEEDSNDSSILPKLKVPSLFKQNPNNTSQFIYTLSNDENLLLDFNNYQCLLQKSN